MVKAKWPWILAGIGLVVTVVPLVLIGGWLANGGLERLQSIFDEEAPSRNRLPIWSRLLEDPKPLESEKVQGITAVYIDNGMIWAHAFNAGGRVQVMEAPQAFGYKEVCCLLGPDSQGRVLGYGTSLDEVSGDIFQIDLGSGEFHVLYHQEDIEALIAYWPAAFSESIAVWEEGPVPDRGQYVGGKIKILNQAGKVVKTLEQEAHRRVIITADGSAVYTLLERSSAYADWLKNRTGAAPDPAQGSQALVFAKIDIASGNVEDIRQADDFYTSWEDNLAYIWVGEDYYSIDLKTGQDIPVPWPDYWLHTTDTVGGELLFGLHTPWPQDATAAHKRCPNEYGVISAIEAGTSKIKTLDVMCYDEANGPELTFGPWSGAIRAATAP